MFCRLLQIEMFFSVFRTETGPGFGFPVIVRTEENKFSTQSVEKRPVSKNLYPSDLHSIASAMVDLIVKISPFWKGSTETLLRLEEENLIFCKTFRKSCKYLSFDWNPYFERKSRPSSGLLAFRRSNVLLIDSHHQPRLIADLGKIFESAAK